MQMKLNKEDFTPDFMNVEEFGKDYKLIEKVQRAAYFIRERDAAKIAGFILKENWKGLIKYGMELKKRAEKP